MAPPIKDIKPGDQSSEANRYLPIRLEEILRRVDALPVLDAGPADGILDHDQHGVPGGKS